MPSRLFAPLILMLLLANPCLLNAAANSLLRQSEAQLRKKQLDDIHYQLSLELPETDTPFSGQLTIDFKFHAQGQPLRLDFSQGEVLSASIQAKPVKFSYDGSAIYFDEKDLQSGVSNQVVVTYKHAYSKDGNGLYWFKDPVDAQVYTYTHFEPYEANKFFPCFDQPDLKATYQLTVKAPKSWTVVSASRETKILEAGEARIWSFPPSLSFSTYLISMHAGPYKVWEDSHYRIPLRIMARQSMAEFMPVEEWFAATRHGFDFFDKYLGYAYPFGKYDQVAVPDFNAGAMENVAAVTFSERFLVRGLRTKADVQGLAGTILHEMAHMWFGDLVTMQWWNDLWLNESFATYASTLAMAADKRFPDTWLGFYRSKIGAYFADQLVSTHPIVSEVFDTDSTSFDGITYGKGAAFLKQLNFYLGDEDFQKGLQIYFKQHAFKNTQLKDFIAAMERASRKDLQHFAEEWLQTAGLNTLSAKITCDKKRIKSFFLEQTAQPGQAILREHKTKVALYKLNRGHLELIKESSVRYEGPLTAWPGAIGLACPDLVLPNQGDFDYVKVKLDRPSFQLASEHLQDLKQPMQRMMLWSAAADSLLDAEISLGDFSQFVARHLPVEKNYEVLRSIEARLSRDYLPYLQWIPDEALRNKLITEISGVYRGQMQSPDLNADIKKLSFEPYLNLLTMHKDTQEILDIFQGKLSWAHWSIGQEQRWDLLLSLSELGYQDSGKLAELERMKDPTSLGRRQFLATQAANPNYEQKLRLLEPIVALDTKMSGAERHAVLSHVFPESQASLKKQYEPIYRQELDRLVKNLEPGLARSYALSLLPISCDASTLPLIDELISKKFTKSIHDGLRVARQNNARCQAMMARLHQSMQI